MKVDLKIPAHRDGFLVSHTPRRRLAGPTHKHEELEINLVTGGSAHYLLGSRRYELQRRSLVWLFPGQEHGLAACSPDFCLYVAVFTPRLVQFACEQQQRARSVAPPAQPPLGDLSILKESDPAGYFCRTLPAERATGLAALMKDLALLEKDPARLNLGLAYLLLESWTAYQQADEISASSHIHPAVERALSFLQVSEEHLSLPTLSSKSGLSSSRLSRMFKAQTGSSLADYRNRQRLDRFFPLYGGGVRITMLHAALQAGFGSYPQFHRVFKRLMGISPAEYRRRLAREGA